jgi:hypothetical protein
MAKRKPRQVATYTVRIPAGLQESLNNICRIENKSHNDAVVESLAEYVQSRGDFIESRLHFKMSLAYILELYLGRIERFLRQYLAVILNLLIFLVEQQGGTEAVKKAFSLAEDTDKDLYPGFRDMARRIEPPEPEDWGPKKLRIPKQ